MNYNTILLETPEQVSDLLIKLSGIDIYKQTRKKRIRRTSCFALSYIKKQT